jgi:hypothetical protein
MVPSLVIAALALVAPVAASAQPFEPGHLIAAFGDRVLELAPDGGVARELVVPFPGGDRDTIDGVRDALVSPSGLLHVYNGTRTPWLSSFDPHDGSWTHRTHPGWSTIFNVTYGGIVERPPFVFVTDQDTGDGHEAGIIRFDLESGEATRFAETYRRPGSSTPRTTSYVDLALGPDGLLYALNTEFFAVVDVYEPDSLAFVRSVWLGFVQLRGLAVDGAGRFFAVGGGRELIAFDADGVRVGALDTLHIGLADVDLLPDGRILLASASPRALLRSDPAFSALEALPIPSFSISLFGGFVPARVREVAVEVRPGSGLPRLRAGSAGVVPVAILGSDDLDVPSIDARSLAFGPAGVAPEHEPPGHLEDVDGDGRLDLLLHFRLEDAGFEPGDEQACLAGALPDGTRLQGCDAVEVRP